MGNEELSKKKDELTKVQDTLTAQLTNENRDLKTTLLDAERYKEELRDLLEVIADLEAKILKTRTDLDSAKEELRKLRIKLAMPDGKLGRPKFNKDTRVNLDMSMWIIHNVTKEEGE